MGAPAWVLSSGGGAGLHSREGGFALLHVLALGSGPGFATQVDGDAHEQATLVQEVAGDVHGHQEQDEGHDKDAHDGASAQARGGAAVGLGGRERGMGVVSTCRCKPGPAEQQPWGWGGARWTATAFVSRMPPSLGLLGVETSGSLPIFKTEEWQPALRPGDGAQGSHQPGQEPRLAPCLRLWSQPALGWSPREPWELPGTGSQIGAEGLRWGSGGSPGLLLGLWGCRGQDAPCLPAL